MMLLASHASYSAEIEVPGLVTDNTITRVAMISIEHLPITGKKSIRAQLRLMSDPAPDGGVG